MFNKNFGSCFRAAGEPTLFAFSLRRYVDIYTSQVRLHLPLHYHHTAALMILGGLQVENLRFYSPNHRFFPERGISMPHDPRFSLEVPRAVQGE